MSEEKKTKKWYDDEDPDTLFEKRMYRIGKQNKKLTKLKEESGYKGYPTMEMRADILRKALEEKRGISYVNEALEKFSLLHLYTRNPSEFLMNICFLRNDAAVSEDEKLGINDYEKLYGELKKLLKKSKNNAKTVFKENAKRITLGDLRDFVESNRENYELNSSGGACITQTLDVESESVDYSLDKKAFLGEVIDIMDKHANDFTVAYRGSQYYFCKYLLITIVTTLRSFRNLLHIFSQSTPFEVYSEYINKKSEAESSLEENFISPFAINYPLIQFDEAYYNGAFDKTRLKNMQPSGAFISEIIKTLPVSGKTNTSNNKLFVKSLSNIKDHPIFRSSNFVHKEIDDRHNDNNKHISHEELAEAIKNLSINDFYEFELKREEIYHLLFEKLFDNSRDEDYELNVSNEESSDINNDKEQETVKEEASEEKLSDGSKSANNTEKSENIFSDKRPRDHMFYSYAADGTAAGANIAKADKAELILQLIKGECELSRSALMLFLCSCKAITENVLIPCQIDDTKNEDKKFELPPDHNIDKETIGAILERCRFESIYDLAYDKFYIEMIVKTPDKESVDMFGAFYRDFVDFSDDIFHMPLDFSGYYFNKNKGKKKQK